ncbi:hypothetical protein ABT317_21305, partial [Streptomyces carpinensis]
MSQQGGRPTGREDDWWGQLYDDSTGDTGPTAAADSLDDRFASAAGTLGRTPGAARTGGTPPQDRPGKEAGDRTGHRAEDRLPPEDRTEDDLTPEGRIGDWLSPEEWTEDDLTPEDRIGDRLTPEDRIGDRLPPRDSTEDRVPPEDRPRRSAPQATVPAPRTAHPAAQPPDEPDAGPAAEEPDAPPVPRRPAADAPRPPGPAPDWWERAPWDPLSPKSAGPTTDPPALDPPEPATHGDTASRSEPYSEAAPRPETSPGTAPRPGTSPDPTSRPEQDTRADTPADTPRTAPDPDAPAPEPSAGPGSLFAVTGPPEPIDEIRVAPSAPDAEAVEGPGGGPEEGPDVPQAPPVTVAHVGSRPPTYDAEPTALPVVDPDELDDLTPDTVLDGARYGACTLRAVSIRGDSPRYRGEPRRDALLTARFGQGEQA